MLKTKKLKSPLSLSLSAAVLVSSMLVSGCTLSQLDKLERVGIEPPMEKIEDPTAKPDYAPISWPVPDKGSSKHHRTTNSLWSGTSKTFFSDARAKNVGDILMVKVEIQDKAELDNKTERKRNNLEDLDLPGVFGFEDKLLDSLPGDIKSPQNILSVSGTTDSTGEGIIEREEIIETEVAAVITQVLPNGNFVITGTQEIRVNYEVRQLTIAGIISPKAISESNQVALNQIAEARVSYGGRGLISDLQQPRIGNQIVDILSPF